MPYNLSILCLANSTKHQGRCIAGKIVENGKIGLWCRPMSASVGHAISDAQQTLTNGHGTEVLDIVSITCLEAKPSDYQTENHLIDENVPWQHVGSVDWSNARKAIDVFDGPLWHNDTSSFNGLNDEISLDDAKKFTSSLVLIETTDLKLKVGVEGPWWNEQRCIRAKFHHNNHEYWLKVTDIALKNEYLAKQNDTYGVGKGLAMHQSFGTV